MRMLLIIYSASFAPSREFPSSVGNAREVAIGHLRKDGFDYRQASNIDCNIFELALIHIMCEQLRNLEIIF